MNRNNQIRIPIRAITRTTAVNTKILTSTKIGMVQANPPNEGSTAAFTAENEFTNPPTANTAVPSIATTASTRHARPSSPTRTAPASSCSTVISEHLPFVEVIRHRRPDHTSHREATQPGQPMHQLG